MNKNNKIVAGLLISAVLLGAWAWSDEKKKKQSASANLGGSGTGLNDTENLYKSQDDIVNAMISQITTNYSDMVFYDQFQGNIDKLTDAALPKVIGTVQCFAAPCPQVSTQQVSTSVENAAKELIDKMTADRDKSLYGGTGGGR